MNSMNIVLSTLRQRGERTSAKRIARLMRQERIWARQRSKYRVATTGSRHDNPIAPHRLLQLKANRPDQV